jgi:hypothetical protein
VLEKIETFPIQILNLFVIWVSRYLLCFFQWIEKLSKFSFFHETCDSWKLDFNLLPHSKYEKLKLLF